MMRRLLSESEESMKSHVGRVCSDAVAQHVQPLKAEIAQERTERTQFQNEVKEEIGGLRERLDKLEGHRSRPGQDYSNEIVIGGFGEKSKEGAIAMVILILRGQDGNPQIIDERVAAIPRVVRI